MSDIQEPFVALVADKSSDGEVTTKLSELKLADLPAGDVVVEVAYSSLNYKDALACGGHPGVVRSLPHVPGIDCAGTVAASNSDDWKVGDPVLVTGYGLGAEQWGGYSQYVRVPADWVVAMPEGLDARHAMTIGTAGFTAAQSVAAIVGSDIQPDRGPVVVTGATGGVGMWSVAILAKLGYEVTAVSGKPEQIPLLKKLGAAEVVGREAVNDTSDRPLLKSKWAAAVDTVGGTPLTTILRSTLHRGCVTACGLVAGADLPLTVHPFILRGVTLAGVDSAKCPRPMRLEMWKHLSTDWKVDLPEDCLTEITLSEVPNRVKEIMAGKVVGRTLVVPKK
ncbi:YhdH/YhfP family quinone oxidoreductase [Aeoliella sp. ICT_H6.2]|uniref:YhdH/YhfP family quinone oxidoreductase n=1 Tax=Aeoliella straminimaris TaxID=2954799 RepID=A0A9X2F5U8_9BACT|nr:YhdH/YhfP family quinone oxidoreductase [Aeoliella straminimaris]MCO6042785.1 YhdH/YhfP family quinone oxidoreductase [Aeoliella straminimaris]